MSFLIHLELIILGTLDIPGHITKKWYYQIAENFDVYLHGKKSTSFLTSFLKYHKYIANLSGILGIIGKTHQKR